MLPKAVHYCQRHQGIIASHLPTEAMYLAEELAGPMVQARANLESFAGDWRKVADEFGCPVCVIELGCIQHVVNTVKKYIRERTPT